MNTRQDQQLALFLDEEKRAADTLIGQLGGEVSNVYCLRIHSVDRASASLEEIAAAYLLTNAVLMSRTPRKIRKFLSFSAEDSSMLYAFSNSLRGLLQGGFTSLSQMNTWKQIVSTRWEIADNLTKAVAEAVSFFETSGISSGAADYHRAEILIGVEGRQPEHIEGGQFVLDDADVFSPVLRGEASSYPVAVSDIFRRTGLQLATGLKGRNVLVSIDCRHLEPAMANWLGNLHHVLELDFYKVGGRA
jgi:hypothetical protein